ncbi:PEP-CTERM sorting domain-containing protein [Frigidibacter oleivorans]|uniref:PEP-CTERM sorting domain-containing protein n=1 Tax=Frigidibacter oleivorans TaxID=2487129 RepID=UPI000F8F1259|nr:PEP-CTERM sorting domain-containing protein [Frigidibacter oleivorans]
MAIWHGILGVAALLLPPGVSAATLDPAPVDLTGWQVDDAVPNSGRWLLQPGTGNVIQTRNGAPSILWGDDTGQDMVLDGSVSVTTAADDDFWGFVLGYDSGEITSAEADYWLIDWKQADGGGAEAGLALSHVSGPLVSGGDAWDHGGTEVTEVARATGLGDSGWQDGASYDFRLSWSAELIELQVNGQTELHYSSADWGQEFGDGGIGLYVHSQQNVPYSALTLTPRSPVPVPLPAAIGPMAMALLLLAAAGLRRHGRRRAHADRPDQPSIRMRAFAGS